jgi:hypothetical protein
VGILKKTFLRDQVIRLLGSIPASVGTVDSEGRQMKQC